MSSVLPACCVSSRIRSAAAISRVPVPQAGSVIRSAATAAGSLQSQVFSLIASEASSVAAGVVV